MLLSVGLFINQKMNISPTLTILPDVKLVNVLRRESKVCKTILAELLTSFLGSLCTIRFRDLLELP